MGNRHGHHAGGLNGITNALLATLEPGDEVILTSPIYAGLVNRVRLASGVPVFVAATPTADGWHVEADAVEAAITPRTRMLLLMSPAMPTGAVHDESFWIRVAELAERHDLWILVDAAMERLRFDGRPPFSPASLDPAVARRTITVGSVSKEYRMIGWRVGWVVGPTEIMADVHTIGLTNVVCQVGLAQRAAAAVLSDPDSERDLEEVTRELGRRRDTLMQQLSDYPAVRPDGGWSLLLDCRPLGRTPEELSERLLVPGGIAATPMAGWGPGAEHYLRFVFANEPVERLETVRERLDQALG